MAKLSYQNLVDSLSDSNIEELEIMKDLISKMISDEEKILHDYLVEFDLANTIKQAKKFNGNVQILSLIESSDLIGLTYDNLDFIQYLEKYLGSVAINPTYFLAIIQSSFSDIKLLDYVMNNEKYKILFNKCITNNDSLFFIGGSDVLSYLIDNKILNKNKLDLFFLFVRNEQFKEANYLVSNYDITINEDDIKYVYLENRFKNTEGLIPSLENKYAFLKDLSLTDIITALGVNKVEIGIFKSHYGYSELIETNEHIFTEVLNSYQLTKEEITKMFNTFNNQSLFTLTDGYKDKFQIFISHISTYQDLKSLNIEIKEEDLKKIFDLQILNQELKTTVSENNLPIKKSKI